MLFRYHANIHIQERPVGYRREVSRYLNLVRTTHVGRTLVKFIGQKTRRLLIVPFKPMSDNPINAFAAPDKPEDSYPKDYPLMNPVDLPGGTA